MVGAFPNRTGHFITNAERVKEMVNQKRYKNSTATPELRNGIINLIFSTWRKSSSKSGNNGRLSYIYDEI